MGGAGPGQVVCSSQPLWSYTPSCPSERPSAVVLHSICSHAPLQSITAVPAAPAPPSWRAQPPALAPFKAYEHTDIDRASHQQRQQQHLQQQQLLEQLMLSPDAAVVNQQEGSICQPLLLQQQQQQQLPEAAQSALDRLVSAGKWQLQLDPTDLQQLLQQLQPFLHALQPGQLAHTAHAVSVLPHGAAAAAELPGWQPALLEAAARLFSTGQMDAWASSVLLQALARLCVRPGSAWLAAACAGMEVSAWRCSRALSTVAACLPQLGHAPSRSWATAYFAATADGLHEWPEVSLARMVHGVVAWRHLRQRQQQQQDDQLVIPEGWLCRALQELQACSSSKLKPCEVAMVIQALARLQQPEPSADSTSGAAGVMAGSSACQQPQSPLMLCIQQLLHALVPAVVGQRREFGPQDFAVVLHSLAQLQQQNAAVNTIGVQAGQEAASAGQELCSWDWLRQVLPSVEACLPRANARTQATILWAAAALMQPHLQQQAQQQRAQQQQQRQKLMQQLPPQLPQTTNQLRAPSRPQPLPATVSKPGQPSLVRPVWQAGSQQQQATAVAAVSEAAAAISAAAAAGAAAVQPAAGTGEASSPAAGGNSLRSALETLAGAAAAAPISPAAVAAAAASAGPDAASVWSAWLDGFYAASMSHLPAYSAEDLVVSACTLATQQQVPPASWYEQLLSAVHSQLGAMSQGHLSGVAWALGRMALLPCRHNPRASLVPLQPWLHALYQHTTLGGPAAAGASAAAAGLGVGQAVGSAASVGVKQRMCSAAEVVRLMWAAAVCDYDPGDEWWHAAEQLLLTPVRPAANMNISTLSPDDYDGGRSSTAGMQVPGLAAASQGKQQQQQQQQLVITGLPTRLLGALLQAYVASGRQLPVGLLQATTTPAVCQQLCAGPVSNMLRVLRALGRTGSSVPQQWLLGLAVGLQDRLVLLSGRELGQLLLGLAGTGLQGQAFTPGQEDPVSSSSSGGGGGGTAGGSAWVQALCSACEVRLRGMAASDICRLLWAAAKLQLQLPAETKQALLQQLQAGFLDAPPAALAVSIDAITRLRMVPSRDWLGSYLMATHRTYTAAAAATAATTHNTGSVSSSISSIWARQALAATILQTLQGLARLKVAPPAKWLKQQLLLLHGQLPMLQPRHIASLLLLLARLKCRPSPTYLHSMLGQLGDCSSCSALDIAHIAYGISSLRWQPRRHWMQRFLAASASKLHEMSHQGLALTHWALAVTRVVPPELTWRREALQAVGARLGQFDALQMSMIVWAWGRLQVHLTPYAGPTPAIVARWAWQQLPAAEQPAAQQAYADAGAGPQDSSRGGGSSRCGGGGGAAAGSVPPVLGQHWQQRRQLAQQLLAAALQLRGQYNASQLCHLVVGLAKLQLYPTQAWLHAMVMQGSSQPLSALDGYQMQQLLWALARLQYRAPEAWVDSMGLLLETKWQQNTNTRHSAEWALRQLQTLATQVPLW